MHVPLSQIPVLHAAVIIAGIDRDALVAGIDPRFVASLPRHANQAAQILADLHTLNVTGVLTDGTFPLRTWLRNAVALAGPRVEGRTFELALRQLDPGSVSYTHLTLPTILRV